MRRPLLQAIVSILSLAGVLWFPYGLVNASAEDLAASQALSDADLEEIRGGFRTDSGLQISFGIEQVTILNGELQTKMALTIPDLTGNPTGVIQSGDWASKVIQSGPGNTSSLNATDLAPNQVLTLIQNSLNNQSIQHMTIIDANVTGLSQFREHLSQSFLFQRPF